MLGVDLARAAVSGQWSFQCSVGVDCSGVEPRCIWLAALRTSPPAEPAAPVSPLQGSRRLLRRHRSAAVKGAKDGPVLSNRNRRRPLSSGEVEGISWRGPRTVVLHKNSQGFGFTLRHFIVYPPTSSLHSLKDKENGNTSGKACAHSCLEPVDTIFVKSVRENGPAHVAGLCTGDRLVKVNGEGILGRTYSQVIALIQNSESVLELSIVPKDQDVLQLACSQDAYLRREHTVSREAQSGPPALDNCPCGPTCSPLDNSPSVQEPLLRSRSSSALRALDFHFNNHNAAIASATLPPPRKSSLPASARAEALCQQALSDWYFSQAQAAEHLSPRSRRVSQDRLAGLGLALGVFPGSAERHHSESLQHHQQMATASYQDSYWLGGGRDVQESRGRVCSQNLLAAYEEYEHNYGRSVETLKQATALVSPQSQPPHHRDSELPALSPVAPPTGEKQVAEPQTPARPSEGDSNSHSPSFSRRSTFLSPSTSDGSISTRPLSSPVLSPAEEERTTPLKQEVVLRQKPRANGSLAQQALDSLSSLPFIASMKNRRSSYLLAVTTERSKSCDEGLNIFKDEGRVFSKLPKRVKSFFLDGSLDSLRAQEEARNKRHSTSELGTTAVSNVRKEGWLLCKQVLSEKGKKLGSGIRPWKRIFSVLRSHSLFLYKDKREAVLHGAGASPGQEEHSPICVRGCLVDIAYSETKRKHVLRLTTQDFCEYLLQAESREDMLSWIKAIRDNSKSDTEEIGFSRQALINKKMNDYRKHSLTSHRQDSSPKGHRIMPPLLLAKTDNSAVTRSSKSEDNKALWGINLMKKNKKMSAPKAFGVRLEDCQPAVNHKFVPLIVEMCCAAVETLGLEYTGVYRVPGNNALVSSLQDHLNKGLDINSGDERWQDLNVISSLLKSFFRKLPEPLFTDDKYSAFIEANRIENGEDRLQTMKKLIHDLPDYYYHTLKFLVTHLKKVADHSEKNKMEPRNLALVFGPTLVRTSEDNMTDMVTHMPDRYKIVETLILHCDWFFSDGPLDKEKAPELDRDSPPVPNIDHLLCNIGRAGGPGDHTDSTIDSLKLKISLSPRKDLNAKEFLSAVTRKRKISPDDPTPGDDTQPRNLEHEPVKSSNLRREDTEDTGDREDTEFQSEGLKDGPILKQEGSILKQDSPILKQQGDNANKSNRRSRVTFEDTSHLMDNRQLRHSADLRRERHRRLLLRPHSFHYLQPPPTPTYTPSSQTPTKLLAPVWSPRGTRVPPAVYYTSSFYAPHTWVPAVVPMRVKKPQGSSRSRALSMTLELEDRARGWRTDKVEVVRVNERGVPQGSAIATMSFQQVPARGNGLWSDHSRSSSSSVVPVVLRRFPKQREQGRGWRRHTVIV